LRGHASRDQREAENHQQERAQELDPHKIRIINLRQTVNERSFTSQN
jgi:Fe-S-cluster formation regulator IscX/YfhJ